MFLFLPCYIKIKQKRSKKNKKIKKKYIDRYFFFLFQKHKKTNVKKNHIGKSYYYDYYDGLIW